MACSLPTETNRHLNPARRKQLGVARRPGSVAFYVPNLNHHEFGKCNDLWGYISARPHVRIPQNSAAKLARFRATALRIRALAESNTSASERAFQEYLTACYALFAT
jgi:hypothetical protein